MPGFEFKAGELRHQVEFGRPDVTVRAAHQSGLAPVPELEVVRHEMLAKDVVGVDADVPGFTGEHHGLLTRREFPQFRHPQLDEEPAAGTQVPGGITEAVDLLSLGEQVGERVEDEVQRIS